MTEIKTVSPYIFNQFPDFVKEDHPKFIEFIKSYYEWMESYNNPLYLSNTLKFSSNINQLEERIKIFSDEIGTSYNGSIEAKDLSTIINIPASSISNLSPGMSVYIFGSKLLPKDAKIVSINSGKIKISPPALEPITNKKFEFKSGILESNYIDQLFKEFLVSFPSELSCNKELLLKNIKQYYRARGTEKSFELFFRALFGANPEFYYPRTDILKVSDGKWIKEKSLIVYPELGSDSPFKLVSNRIVGKTSGAVAFVEKVLFIQSGAYSAYEIFLNRSSISGKFLSDEIISSSSSKANSVSAIIGSSPKSIVIKNSGTGYSIGQKFAINFQPGNGLEIKIDDVGSLGEIKKLSIVKYGIGYNTTFPITNYTLAGEGDENATIDVILDAMIDYPGYYLNEDGQLSTSKYIQDSYFYQQFSYVIYVSETLGIYESLLKKMLHPAGFKLFGGIRVVNDIDSKIKTGLPNYNLFKSLITPSKINASAKISTMINTIINPKPNTSHPFGSTLHSIYRDRFSYRPSNNIWTTKQQNNSPIVYSSYTELEIGNNLNYYGVLGDLSEQYAITPISFFENIGLTPFILETQQSRKTNIAPDSVIVTSV